MPANGCARGSPALWLRRHPLAASVVTQAVVAAAAMRQTAVLAKAVELGTGRLAAHTREAAIVVNAHLAAVAAYERYGQVEPVARP